MIEIKKKLGEMGQYIDDISPLFQAMTQEFGGSHKPGRVQAFKLMCMLTTRSHRLKPSTEHIKYFYRFLHEGLTGNDQVRLQNSLPFLVGIYLLND